MGSKDPIHLKVKCLEVPIIILMVRITKATLPTILLASLGNEHGKLGISNLSTHPTFGVDVLWKI